LQQVDNLKRGLVAAVDADFGIYEGATFTSDRFAEFWVHQFGRFAD